MDLNVVWFILLGFLLTGYAVLDGFDLGVGILHFVARRDEERRIFMNSIGPLWDGNEVWLVTFGGALFAAFPECYGTAFSGFYTPFVILLFALIFRAVSLEFRSKLPARLWRGFWDGAFSFSSAGAAFLFGVAVGNVMVGLPIGADREFHGTLLGLLRPYPLLVGLFVVIVFAQHGSIYLYLKTQGELQGRVRDWIWRMFKVFLVFYILTTIFALVYVPNATRNFGTYPVAWGVVVLNVLAIAGIPLGVYLGRPFYAFVSSACAIATFSVLFGMALFPNLLVSSIDPAYNLTIYTASSSQKTLGIMLLMVILGMPFVIGYTSIIYWVFRGKVEVSKLTY